jgi:hypothetical protein
MYSSRSATMGKGALPGGCSTHWLYLAQSTLSLSRSRTWRVPGGGTHTRLLMGGASSCGRARRTLWPWSTAESGLPPRPKGRRLATAASDAEARTHEAGRAYAVPHLLQRVLGLGFRQAHVKGGASV